MGKVLTEVSFESAKTFTNFFLSQKQNFLLHLQIPKISTIDCYFEDEKDEDGPTSPLRMFFKDLVKNFVNSRLRQLLEEGLAEQGTVRTFLAERESGRETPADSGS